MGMPVEKLIQGEEGACKGLAGHPQWGLE